ncbi:MAG TPA: hypothetical protein VKY36_00010 [Moheibacter sp.]|nr:hypothetical protein [Moheibacter sp.]
MKKLIIAASFLPVFAFAQVEEENSGIVQLGNNSKEFFIKDGQGYKLKDYNQIFTNSQAIDHIRKAKTNKTFGSIVLYTGSFFVGFGVGFALSVKDSKKEYGYSGYEDLDKKDRQFGWIIAGSGLGVALASIPLWSAYSKNIKKAIEIENGTAENSVSELKLNVNGNGFGVAYHF